jgi:hypothetical protein
MAVTINADNGAVSGSAGLKQAADSTGVLALQTNGTTAVSISTGQVVTLTNALPVASGGTGTTSTTFVNLTTNVTGTLPVANGGTGVTSSTGSGSVVLGTSPTLTTPTINSAQVATVSGTAPLYMCRAWVNFNGLGTVAGSGNVTSVTRNTTGDFTVNFTTGMPDASYSCVTSAARTINNAFMSSIYYSSGLATGSARVRCWEDAGAAQDPNVFCVSIFR